MIDRKPTYDFADPFIGRFVQPIAAGDLAPPFEAQDEEGRLVRLADDYLSGKDLVLVFLNNAPEDKAVSTLRSFGEAQECLLKMGVTVLAVHSGSNAEVARSLKAACGFPWPVLSDPGGTIHAQYGLHKNHGVTVRIVLLSPYRQIRCWYDNPVGVSATIEIIETQVRSAASSEFASWYPTHAPVLIVPNVLSREECRRLIDIFEGRGEFYASAKLTVRTDIDFKIPVYEYNREDRIDHVFREQSVTGFIDEMCMQHVYPMVRKAFAFDVTRREDLHIARYVGKRGGNHIGHRDNSDPSTAHRRFAFSMNLNDDYEGGGLVFREFAERAYRTDPGTAIIFSSSSLHEVQEVARGVRYSLITHLFNDAAIKA